MTRRHLLIYLFFFLLFHQLYAANDSLTVFTSKDSILVIANRYPVSIKNIGRNYQLIPAETIAALSTHSVLEAIDLTVPSAFVLNKSVVGYGIGSDGGGQLYLRGQGGRPNTNVLVLLNGHPDFMGIFGHPLPDVYGNQDIRQVEVLPGAASTVYGDHAMGGVINIVTGTDYKHLGRVEAEGGSFHTFHLGINLSRHFGPSGFYLSMQKDQTDGHIKQSSFSSLHFNGGWEYQLNPTWHLAIQGRYVPYRFDDPARGTSDPARLGTYAVIRRSMAGLILKNTSSSLSGSLQLYGNYGFHRFYDGFKSQDFAGGFSIYQYYQFSSKWKFAFGGDAMRFGGQAENAFAKLPNGKPVVNTEFHALNSGGLYALAFYQPVSWFHLKSGFRFQYNSHLKNNSTPVLGISANPGRKITLFANYQSGFRNPTLMELYLFPSANKNLRAEESRGFESGLVYRPDPRTEIRFTAYKYQIRNLIQSLPNSSPPPMFRFINSGRSDLWGYEVQTRYRFSKTTAMQLAYASLDPGETTAFNPRYQFKYALFSGLRAFRIALFGKYISKLFAGNNKQIPLPDYHLLDVTLSYHFKKSGLRLRILNALDRNYFVWPSYPGPGRQIRIGSWISF